MIDLLLLRSWLLSSHGEVVVGAKATCVEVLVVNLL
jgi:hypothetical protein